MMCLITKAGNEVLTGKLVKEIDDIEALMKSGNVQATKKATKKTVKKVNRKKTIIKQQKAKA